MKCLEQGNCRDKEQIIGSLGLGEMGRYGLMNKGFVFEGKCSKIDCGDGCVVATLSGKLTQKDNADSEVQFITPAGPRQSLLLAKDPDQHL